MTTPYEAFERAREEAVRLARINHDGSVKEWVRTVGKPMPLVSALLAIPNPYPHPEEPA